MRRRGEGCQKGVGACMRWLFQVAMMVAMGGEAPEVPSPAAAVKVHTGQVFSHAASILV